jgi:hypothetical protein
MLASITGSSPYARQIMYQYTSVMIAPIMIAAIEGSSRVLRNKTLRYVAMCWLLACSYVSNTAWSPSPLDDVQYRSVWATPNARVAMLNKAISLVPKGARITGTYSVLPHLSGRRYAYDWPNPWEPSYWGNDLPDGSHLPPPHDPNTVDWIVLDMYHVGEAQLPLVHRLIGEHGEGGEFQVMYISHITKPDPSGAVDPANPTQFRMVEDLRDQVVAAKRIKPGPASTAR